MAHAEITALIEWAETTVSEPGEADGCRTCGYSPYDAIHLTLPHRHPYVDPRPLAMLATIGRQLLDERDAAVRKLAHETFVLKCDNDSLALQLRLRVKALEELAADAERGRFEDRALQVANDHLKEENDQLRQEIEDYKNSEAVAEVAVEREIHIRETQKWWAALSAQGRGIERLRAERNRARALGHELAGLAFHVPSDEKDRRIAEIDGELGFGPYAKALAVPRKRKKR